MVTNTYGIGHDVSTNQGRPVQHDLVCEGDYQDNQDNLYDCWYEGEVTAMEAPDGTRTVDCPACGHENIIR